jgi:hypothetical protein
MPKTLDQQIIICIMIRRDEANLCKGPFADLMPTTSPTSTWPASRGINLDGNPQITQRATDVGFRPLEPAKEFSPKATTAH